MAIVVTAVPLSARANQLRAGIPQLQHRLFNIHAMQVLPSTSHWAKAYVVNGATKSYFFPPDTEITQYNGIVFVRSYNSLWSFSRANVSIRQLSSSSNLNLATLAQEKNTAMAAGVATAGQKRTAIPHDECPDCVTPASGNFLDDTTYGPQPHPTEPPGIPTKAGPGDGVQAVSAQFKPGGSAPPKPMPLSRMQTEKSAACFPSGFVVLTQYGKCVSTATAAQDQPALRRSGRIRGGAGPLEVSGTATAYEFSLFESETYLFGYTPALYSGTLYWSANYFDVLDFTAYGAGEFAVIPSESCEFIIVPTYTEESETQVYWTSSLLQPLGGMQGIYAAFID